MPTNFLWEPLVEGNNTEFNFAYISFKRGNEAKEKKAQMHCVIIGLSDYKNDKEKKTFDEKDVIANRKSNAICEVPKIMAENSPIDYNNLKIETDELQLLVKEGLHWL